MSFFKMRVIFNGVVKEARSETATSDACPWCGFRKQQNKQAKSLQCKPCFTTTPLYPASSVIRFSSCLLEPHLPSHLAGGGGWAVLGKGLHSASQVQCSQNSLTPRTTISLPCALHAEIPAQASGQEHSSGHPSAPRAAEDPQGAPHLPSSTLVFSSYSSAISFPSGNK